MQFKLTALTALAFATISLASPIPGEDDDGGDTNISQCNTGPIQCCNSIQSADSPSAAALLGLLGVVLQDITTQVGLTCSPVTALGVAGNSCSAQPVCCSNNNFNGLIAIGCSPININF